MEEKEIQTCVDGAIKTYFDKFAERVTQEWDLHSKIYKFRRFYWSMTILSFPFKYIEQEKLFKDFGSHSGRLFTEL